MNRSFLLLGALSALLLTACEKKEAPASPSEGPTEASPPAPAPVVPAAAPTEPVVAVDKLPVEEQFEAEAEKEITADNLSAKLDELEKEIAAP